jgi:hypothetical protein
VTTLTVEIPDGTDRSAKALRLELWFRGLTSGCGSFVVLFNNQDDSLTGLFSAENTVDLKINNVDFMKGYVDTVKHVIYDREDVFLHLLRVSGRDYSQDMQNLTHTEAYAVNTRIDDLIDDALNDSGSEITYASGSSESQIAGGFEAKEDYLGDICKDVLERESYDAYVDMSKAFQLIDLSNPPDSGIVLQSVVDSAFNNILAAQPIEYTETDGLPIRNYIKVVGQRVRDGWTDSNASDWTGGTNTAVSDDAVNKKVGQGSILGTLTYDGVNANKFYLDFSGGLYSKTLGYLDWSIYGQEEIMWWARVYTEGAMTGYCLPFVEDTTGNVIDFQNPGSYGMADNTWYWLGAPVGVECEITAPYTDSKWHWITDVDGNFNWQVEKLGFWSVVTGTAANNYPQKIWIDDLRLPEEMVSISEDAGGGSSQALYRKRDLVIPKPYFILQKEVDDYAVSVKTILKNPIRYLKLWAAGTEGIIGNANKWLPANTVTVNIPQLDLNAATYRFVNIHLMAEPKRDLDGTGHDFLAEVDLVPQTSAIIGFIYDALASGKVEPIVAKLEERVRSIEKKRSLSHLDVTTRGSEG